MSLADLAARLEPGARIEVRATPKARRNAVEPGETPDAPLRAWVTAAPEDGKANEAIRKLLAKALGVAPSRLTLVRGATSRDKAFQLD
ncbi:MAG: DUF167 domain-containing protein [Rhodobacteraceae bacterium]|nr:DUF167 domain-containing protein [Paracoccaceae bacterium]MCB1407383.1 DUF167 domain-containing protein [Paracoccaceae bacterium]MCC0080540.1 DUF167 domain-containing protein [Rhodobacter sp.]